MDDDLRLRAAKYFGYADKHRYSVKLNDTDCLIVAEYDATTTLVMLYTERTGRPNGEHFRLSPRAQKEFLNALEAFYAAA